VRTSFPAPLWMPRPSSRGGTRRSHRAAAASDAGHRARLGCFSCRCRCLHRRAHARSAGSSLLPLVVVAPPPSWPRHRHVHVPARACVDTPSSCSCAPCTHVRLPGGSRSDLWPLFPCVRPRREAIRRRISRRPRRGELLTPRARASGHHQVRTPFLVNARADPRRPWPPQPRRRAALPLSAGGAAHPRTFATPPLALCFRARTHTCVHREYASHPPVLGPRRARGQMRRVVPPPCRPWLQPRRAGLPLLGRFFSSPSDPVGHRGPRRGTCCPGAVEPRRRRDHPEPPLLWGISPST
jgi:hypothetical protein